MKTAKPISILLVATVSALLYGAVAALLVPAFSFMYLQFAAAPAQPAGGNDAAMIVAVAAPLFCAALGFICGLGMAFMFNLFVKTERKRQAAIRRNQQVRAAALTDAA